MLPEENGPIGQGPRERGRLPGGGETNPVLARKSPEDHPKQRSVYLPMKIWKQLDRIAEATDYNRNEVIEHFLTDKIRAWFENEAIRTGLKK